MGHFWRSVGRPLQLLLCVWVGAVLISIIMCLNDRNLEGHFAR